jgi:uncharacterized repeat protein (TIGR03803 family)
MIEPGSGRKPVSALPIRRSDWRQRVMRLLLAIFLVMPVFGARAGVVFTTIYSFTNGNDGPTYPLTALVQGSDGYLYGTTSGGGVHANQFGQGGTVFQINTNRVFASLYSFTGGDDGYDPSGLVPGSDHSFYGTTTYGGSHTNQFGGTYGTVFKISTNGQLTTLYAFGTVTNANGEPLDGANPQGGLVQGSDGSFYGTTTYGGVGGGTVFRLTIVPEFQAVTLTNSTLSLTWSTEAGGVYQLQYNSDLSSTNWINLNGPAKATGATLSTTDSLTNGPQRFYRLALLP